MTHPGRQRPTAPASQVGGSADASRVPATHWLLGLAVVAIWGSNFVVIRVGLDAWPPLMMAALRFALALLPALLWVRRPAVPWHQLAAYGGAIGAGQFALLYWALDGHLSPGLASLVIQTQVFFTIGLAMVADGERLRRWQWPALGLAGAGIALIAWQAGGDATPVGVLLVLGAAASWAVGNQVARRMGRVDMLGVVVWSSGFALLPLLALSAWAEGPDRMLAAWQDAGLGAWAAVIWQTLGNTLFGYVAWGWLLARHPAATVVPLALLVPVFGMGASALLLAESMPGWKLLAAALVIAGLALNALAPQWQRLRAPSARPPPTPPPTDRG